MNEDLCRLFFGFELPRETSATAASLRTLVGDPRKAVRWVKGRNIHLTLRFLGATPRTAVDEIVASVTKHLIKPGPLELTIEGTGIFPAATRPRVIWIGLTGDIAGLQALEESVHEAVGPLGFPRQDREFSPHITLGRVRYPQKVTPDVSMFLNSEYDPIRFELGKMHLFESRQDSDGLRYIPLATFPLTADADQE